MATLREDIIRHWQSFKNPLINDILINLEKLEAQIEALSDEECALIKQLVEKCQEMKPSDADELMLIRTFNQMPAAYMLYMIHRLQTVNADLIMKIIAYAQKHKDSNEEVMNFYLRNMVFEKAQLLGRIFSTNRMEAVLGVL